LIKNTVDGAMKKCTKIDLDLAKYKISIHYNDLTQPLVLYFDTPARRFYFSLITLIVHEMKHQDKPSFIYIRKHEYMLRQLDRAISGKHTSKSINDMWAKIRMAWRHRLPDLETAKLFKIENRDLIQPYEKGGKYRYDCSDVECDTWANLFDFDENNIWRLKFAIDSSSLNLDDVEIVLGKLRDQPAWQEYVKKLKQASVDDVAQIKEHQIKCDACGSENSPENQFCSACGQNLKASNKILNVVLDQVLAHSQILSIPKVPTDQPAIEGERKMVTALIIETVDITQLPETHDPEEMHQLMSFLYNILNDRIQTHNGMISQVAEDGVMALFGAPVAQEDHAKHACYAALVIRNALEIKAGEIRQKFGLPLNIRMGLNSGLVVAGTIGEGHQRMYTAIGNTIHIANKIKNLAEPNTIMVSKSTYQFVKDYFEFTSGNKSVKNQAAANDEAYQLIQVGTYDTRIEVADAKGLTKFVGRKNTISRLLNAYDKTRVGSSQVLLLYGEAGSGKSRVLREFREQLSVGDFTYLEGKCLHHGVSIPYLPILDILRSYFDIQSQDNESVVRAKIKAKTKDLEWVQKETPEFIREILTATSNNATLYQQLSPEQRRKRTFSVIKELLFSSCREKPLVVAVEDFHWIDRTSEDFFLNFINYLGNSKILMIIVYRPEYAFQQIGKVDCTQINLSPLTSQSSLELLQAILKSHKIDKELKDFIFERSAGNPLIIEEITYSLIEQGAIENKGGHHTLHKNIEKIQLPDSIKGIIAARIDRLEDTLKMIIQTSSVIGRAFSFDILKAVIGMEADLRHHLLSLQRMDFIYEQEAMAASEYIFKHALIQEVAYNELLIKKRRTLHAKIARSMESIFTEHIERLYGELSYHYERAEIKDKAIHYMILEGNRAANIFANEEALTFYRKAIDQISPLMLPGKKNANSWMVRAAKIYESMGDVLLLTGRQDESRNAFQKALGIASNEDQIMRSCLQRKIGKTYVVKLQYDKMQHSYEAAESILGPPPANPENAWWHEWLEIQFDKISMFYFQNKIKQMKELVEKARPLVGRHATPEQQARFFWSLAMTGYRSELINEGLVSQKTIDYCKAAVSASKNSGDRNLLGTCQFILGFSCLWGNQFELAEKSILAAMSTCKQTGNLIINSRCHTYLTILYRRLGQIEKVRANIQLCIKISKDAKMPEYTGVAKANLAWIAWHDRDFASAEKSGKESLEIWQTLPSGNSGNVLIWLALLPLIAVALHQDKISEAIENVRDLFVPGRMPLPAKLAELLQHGLDAWETGQSKKTTTLLGQAVELAQELHIL
jgi:class 3 adenylate cyclase/tetratricopeptide (TPR) repeat protein